MERVIHYAGIIEDDVVNGNGICVSVFMQGCPHCCKGCFNEEAWDRNGGIAIHEGKLIDKVIEALRKNDICRNLSFLGGEPLVYYNLHTVKRIIEEARGHFPDIKIFLWSGYTYEDLLEKRAKDKYLDDILNMIDVLIDGPYVHELHNVLLKFRGSSNQRLIDMKETNRLSQLVIWEDEYEA